MAVYGAKRMGGSQLHARSDAALQPLGMQYGGLSRKQQWEGKSEVVPPRGIAYG